MSTPEKEMANLNLGENQTLSARQAGQQRRRAREAQLRATQAQTLHAQQQARIQPSPASTSPGPVQMPYNVSAMTNISYSLSHVDHSLHNLVKDALSYPAKYDIELAFERQDQAGKFYAFQLKKSETVRIYLSGTEFDHTHIACSCSVYPQFGLCEHIVQLQDGLVGELGGDDLCRTVLGLDKDSIELRLNALSSQIGFSLYSLPDALNFSGATESESEVDPEDIKDLQDMLSVLDENMLPHEFDEDFREEVPAFEQSMPNMVVPGKPLVSLWGLAKYDVTLFTRLRNAITKEVCEKDFLDKLHSRSDGILDRFRHYTEYGPHLRENVVHQAANGLRRVVSTLRDYLDSRAPTTVRFNSGAGDFLVMLLCQVLLWDRDIYEPLPKWLSSYTATTQAPSSPDLRNLFANLILHGSGGSSHSSFALDLLNDGRLRALIPENCRSLLQQMHTRLQARHAGSSAPSGPRSPRTSAMRAWTEELRQLLENIDETDVPGVIDPPTPVTLRSARSSASTTARRRPSNLEERESRRRRVH